MILPLVFIDVHQRVVVTPAWIQHRGGAIRTIDCGSSKGGCALLGPDEEQVAPEGIAGAGRLVEALLEAGWLLVALLIPLAVNLWAREPFEPPKAALLRTLAWLLVAAWLADGLVARRAPWRELRPNPLLPPALALAAVQILAAAAAPDRGLSLWGSYERAQGLLTLLSYLILFLVVSARLRTLDRARRLIGAMAATAAPLVALAGAQALGWQPAGLVTDARSPLFATLGRSNFLGAYLAMLLPLTVALAWTARVRARLALALLAAGQLTVIALTLSRGAWLAAGAGLVILVAALAPPWLAMGRRLAGRRQRAALVSGLLVAAGGLGAVLWLAKSAGSTAARLSIWQATAELIARRPSLGYGPDGLGLAFPGIYPPELVYYQGRGLTVDRAHNLFLDWAAVGGLPGLLAGLALLAIFFRTGSQLLGQASGERRVLLAGCLAAVAANAAGNLVGFDVTATAAASWLLLALLPALAGWEPALPRAETAPAGRSQAWRRAAAGLLVLAVAAAVVQFNVRPLAADVAAWTADRRAMAGDGPGAAAAARSAAALWPVEPVHHLSLSWRYLEQARRTPGDPLPWLQQAEAELLIARNLRPADPQIWGALGELYGLWGTRWDVARLAAAGDAYRRATELAPNQAMLYTSWGMIYLDNGLPASAAGLFRRAVDLDATDAYAFLHLGDAELAQGNLEDALAAYRQAVHWKGDLAPAYRGLAACYQALGMAEEAAQALKRALESESAE
jgi:Flp pilus assembly protein TadD/O-antigen ligase